MKTCTSCHTEKPLGQFYLHYGKPMPECKDCRRTYMRQYYVANRDRVRAYQRAYRAL